MAHRTDAELVDAARRGESDAYGELVYRYQRNAYALAYSLLGDAAEAEDMAQEAFLRALRNLDALADPAKFGAWLHRIVFGTCIDWLRAFRPELYRMSGEPDRTPDVASNEPTPVERLEQIELARRVLEAVAELPPRYRTPLTLYHLDGLSHAKVANSLGVPEATSRSLVARARGRLAAILATDQDEQPAMKQHADDAFVEQTTALSFLHVLNGDETRLRLERSDLRGTFAVWADVLHEGPVPGEDVTAEAWREVRAKYIAEAGHESYEAALARYERWDQALQRYREYDEVVIWCEHDLFDQLLLIRHLDWFARRDTAATKLSLICIGEYPGITDFKGLGELGPDQLASLLDTRQQLHHRQLELGRAAWRAFTSPDPTQIERFLEGDVALLPFLGRALRRHLEEFPWTRDGLSRTEREVLTAVAAGTTRPLDLMAAVHGTEDAYYLTDASLLMLVRGLAAEPSPLLNASELPGEHHDHRAVRRWLRGGALRVTTEGNDVLAGQLDRVRLRGLDRWHGGVHLQGAPAASRWDAERKKLAPGAQLG